MGCTCNDKMGPSTANPLQKHTQATPVSLTT